MIETGLSGIPASLYIGGQWRPAASGKTFDVMNPANAKLIGRASDAGSGDARDAVDAAASAFPDWSTRTAYQRASYLMDAYRLMLERRDDLARIMTLEQGKPLRMARNEVQYAADFLKLVRRGGEACLWQHDPVAAKGPTLRGDATAYWRRRCHNAVELSRIDDHAKGRSSARGRMHNRPQASRTDAIVCGCGHCVVP